MAVIKEITNGKVKITIYDDFCKDKTEAQIKEIIDNVSRRIKEFYCRKAAG